MVFSPVVPGTSSSSATPAEGVIVNTTEIPCRSTTTSVNPRLRPKPQPPGTPTPSPQIRQQQQQQQVVKQQVTQQQITTTTRVPYTHDAAAIPYSRDMARTPVAVGGQQHQQQWTPTTITATAIMVILELIFLNYCSSSIKCPWALIFYRLLGMFPFDGIFIYEFYFCSSG